MEQINLPTEKACEPCEEARQSRVGNMSPPLERLSSKRMLTFAEDVEDDDKVSSQKSSYKDVLSQPPQGLSHRQKLLWLQKRRTAGLWVQCDDCDRWRYMPNVLDRHDLPKNWYCRMNPDASKADCSVPESPIKVCEEEDLIHAEYSAGSVVWARLAGWPWWPAIVDDCPETEQFYWLDGFSDIPTHYNVVFFDSMDVTRAWIAPESLKPYSSYKKTFKIKDKKYNKRLQAAITQADDAVKLSLTDRLQKYSFIARYKGTIRTPKKIDKRDLIKHQKSLKRKYNIDFPIEKLSDDEINGNRQENLQRRNVILLGTPKKVRAETGRVDKINVFIKPNENQVDTENTCDDSAKQLNSMAVHVGSTAAASTEESIDQDTSKTYVPETDTVSTVIKNSTEETDSIIQDISVRLDSPSSDDFEF